MTIHNVDIFRGRPFFKHTKQQLNGEKWNAGYCSTFGCGVRVERLEECWHDTDSLLFNLFICLKKGTTLKIHTLCIAILNRHSF